MTLWQLSMSVFDVWCVVWCRRARAGAAVPRPQPGPLHHPRLLRRRPERLHRLRQRGQQGTPHLITPSLPDNRLRLRLNIYAVCFIFGCNLSITSFYPQLLAPLACVSDNSSLVSTDYPLMITTSQTSSLDNICI